MAKFSKKSLERLKTCDIKLQVIALEAIKEFDFIVVCGHRTKEEQEAAVAAGTSWVHYPNSKHNTMPSQAMDLAPVKYVDGKATIDWNDLNAFHKLSKIILRIAAENKTPLEWGGSWKKRDYPHFQLNLKE